MSTLDRSPVVQYLLADEVCNDTAYQGLLNCQGPGAVLRSCPVAQPSVGAAPSNFGAVPPDFGRMMHSMMETMLQQQQPGTPSRLAIGGGPPVSPATDAGTSPGSSPGYGGVTPPYGGGLGGQGSGQGWST